MANRSTRNKLRYQAEKASTATKRVLEHLQSLDEMANNESQYINEYLPMLVKALLEWSMCLERFSEGL